MAETSNWPSPLSGLHHLGPPFHGTAGEDVKAPEQRRATRGTVDSPPSPNVGISELLYQPLDIDRKEIRVLDIGPAQSPQDLEMDEPLQCELRVVSLLDEPQYNAISYVWGDANARVPIYVNDREFMATKNLDAVLRNLRWNKTALITVWADAVCINQDDLAERGHQVGIMRDIYREAHHVYAWFGEYRTEDLEHGTPFMFFDNSNDNDATSLGSKFNAFQPFVSRWLIDSFEEIGIPFIPSSSPKMAMTRLSPLPEPMESFRYMCDNIATTSVLGWPFFTIIEEPGTGQFRPVPNPRWYNALLTWRWLLCRPWWTRVWTIQEAIVANLDNLSILVHSRYCISIPFKSVAELFKLVMDLEGAGGTISSYGPLVIFIPLIQASLSGFETPSGNSMQPALQDALLIEANMGGEDSNAPNIEIMLQICENRKAEDIRDRLFALLGAAYELVPFEPDYHLSVEEVSCRASKLLLGSGHWERWLKHTPGVSSKDLKSWALDLQGKTDIHWIVPLPGEGFNWHSASSYSRCDQVRMHRQLESIGLVLNATKITVVDSRCHAGATSLPKDSILFTLIGVLKLIEAIGTAQGRLNETLSFWRTILSDRVMCGPSRSKRLRHATESKTIAFQRRFWHLCSVSAGYLMLQFLHHMKFLGNLSDGAVLELDKRMKRVSAHLQHRETRATMLCRPTIDFMEDGSLRDRHGETLDGLAQKSRALVKEVVTSYNPTCPISLFPQHFEEAMSTEEFLDCYSRLQEVLESGRAFFRTQAGDLGQGRAEIEPGDHIYVVEGVQVPVVLRQVKDKPPGTYDLVGECYLDGWMYGRAVDECVKKYGRMLWDEITLR